MTIAVDLTASTIAAQNDLFRRNFGPATWRGSPLLGSVVLSPGVRALGPLAVAARRAIQRFTEFTPDIDPTGQHEFGNVVVGHGAQAHRIWFKISYLDRESEYGSPDPTDPTATRRCMQVMLPTEYC